MCSATDAATTPLAMNRKPADSGPLGLLGGTFDPIHLAHLRLAEEAREALGLEQVCFIPAGDPPHRDAPTATAQHRLAMVRIATAGHPEYRVDDGEVTATGKSYTVLTLERLRQRHGPSRPLVLILGADAFLGITGWHRWADLFTLTHIAVANRASHGTRWLDDRSPELNVATARRIDTDPAALTRAPAGNIVPFEMTALDISASLIRERLRCGRSTRYLLPDSVLDYIQLHNLYRRA